MTTYPNVRNEAQAMTLNETPPKQHYHDLLGVSQFVFARRILVIFVIALLVWWLTRLPEPLIALSAIVVWAGWSSFKDLKDWLTS
jgi:hypothetical protein